MSGNPNHDMLYFQDTHKEKAEFIISDRAKEIMERKQSVTIDEVLTKN